MKKLFLMLLFFPLLINGQINDNNIHSNDSLLKKEILLPKKGFYLVNNKNNNLVFLKENIRLKIYTQNGKSYAGKFKVVDEKTISIKGKQFTLDSIIKIRKAPMFDSIIEKVIIFTGSIIFVGGIALLNSDGYSVIIGILLMPPSALMILLPNLHNNHISSKWKYIIKI